MAFLLTNECYLVASVQNEPHLKWNRRMLDLVREKFLRYVCEAIGAVYNMRLAGKDVFAETAAIFDRSLTDAIGVPALSAAG